jgi:hypothetical protein
MEFTIRWTYRRQRLRRPSKREKVEGSVVVIDAECNDECRHRDEHRRGR